MSTALKKEYISILRLRYKVATKQEKSQIIDELLSNLSLNRNYASRILKREPRWARKPGRKPIYSGDCFRHLKRLWIQMDQMCSKKMAQAFPHWLPFYDCPEAIKTELLKLSPATIDRKLKPFRSRWRRKNRSGTKPGLLLRNLVPVKNFDYNHKKPGHLEVDTVAHCGGSLLGQFAWSITYTDIFSGWTENRAIWSKFADAVLEATKEIESLLPFEIESFNVDNGSEFLNYPLFNYMGGDPETLPRRKRLIMTRSRAYKKNDNCHVEQKNNTHVRELFGYARFDHQGLIPLMNSIYKNEHTLLKNFFIPQLQCVFKLKVGSRYTRKYDKPKTPYQRILDCELVSQDTKDKLTAQYKTLNPFELRKSLRIKIKNFLQALKGYTDEKANEAAAA